MGDALPKVRLPVSVAMSLENPEGGAVPSKLPSSTPEEYRGWCQGVVLAARGETAPSRSRLCNALNLQSRARQ